MRNLLLVLMLAAGCAHPTWWKRGATAESRRLQKYECEKDSRWISTSGNRWSTSSSVELDEDMFIRCMRANGWELYDSPTDAVAAASRDAGR